MKAETALWRTLWKLPMAVRWEELNVYEAVAHYVRIRVEVDRHGGVALMKEMRQLMNDIGLTPIGQQRLRWQTERRETPAAAEPSGKEKILDIRDRIKAN